MISAELGAMFAGIGRRRLVGSRSASAGLIANRGLGLGLLDPSDDPDDVITRVAGHLSRADFLIRSAVTSLGAACKEIRELQAFPCAGRAGELGAHGRAVVPVVVRNPRH